MFRTLIFSCASLIASQSFASFGALTNLGCAFDEDKGHVAIKATYQKTGSTEPQELSDYLGQETFKDPTRYRQLCDRLVKSGLNVSAEEWFWNGCTNNSGGGQYILKIRAVSLEADSSNDIKLLFSPDDPVSDSFIKSVSNEMACDPL